jgi:hypothetical protein
MHNPLIEKESESLPHRIVPDFVVERVLHAMRGSRARKT